MKEKLRALFQHIVQIFWIYLRFMLLVVIIFFLVQWYMRTYEDGEESTTQASPTNKASTTSLPTTGESNNIHQSTKHEL